MNINDVLARTSCKRVIKNSITDEGTLCNGIVELKQIHTKHISSGTCIAQCTRCKSWYETFTDVVKLKAKLCVASLVA